jgi:hypothetical protein
LERLDNAITASGSKISNESATSLFESPAKPQRALRKASTANEISAAATKVQARTSTAKQANMPTTSTLQDKMESQAASKILLDKLDEAAGCDHGTRKRKVIRADADQKSFRKSFAKSQSIPRADSSSQNKSSDVHRSPIPRGTNRVVVRPVCTNINSPLRPPRVYPKPPAGLTPTTSCSSPLLEKKIMKIEKTKAKPPPRIHFFDTKRLYQQDSCFNFEASPQIKRSRLLLPSSVRKKELASKARRGKSDDSSCSSSNHSQSDEERDDNYIRNSQESEELSFGKIIPSPARPRRKQSRHAHVKNGSSRNRSGSFSSTSSSSDDDSKPGMNKVTAAKKFDALLQGSSIQRNTKAKKSAQDLEREKFVNEPRHWKYFTIFKLSRQQAMSATEAETKKLFKDRARSLHPDKGGCAAKFQLLEKARDILLDRSKLAAYERDTIQKLAYERPDLFSEIFDKQEERQSERAFVKDILDSLSIASSLDKMGRVCPLEPLLKLPNVNKADHTFYLHHLSARLYATFRDDSREDEERKLTCDDDDDGTILTKIRVKSMAKDNQKLRNVLDNKKFARYRSAYRWVVGGEVLPKVGNSFDTMVVIVAGRDRCDGDRSDINHLVICFVPNNTAPIKDLEAAAKISPQLKKQIQSNAPVPVVFVTQRPAFGKPFGQRGDEQT